MAWIPAAISGIVGLVGMGAQNQQTKAANQNNQQQQAAQLANAAQNAQMAQATVAPWLQQGASPYGNANSVATNAVGPLALAGGVPQKNAASAVMQPPQRQTQPVARAPQGLGAQLGAPAPAPRPQPQAGLNPAQIAQVQQIMRQPQVSTQPVSLG